MMPTLGVMMIYTVGSLGFLVMNKHFENWIISITEIFNEITYLTCLYFSFYFTDYAPSIEESYNIGFIYILLILCFTLINLILFSLMISIELLSIIREGIKKRKFEN